MSNVAERTKNLKEAIAARMPGVAIEEEENLMHTLRWLDLKDAKTLVEVEVHADWYGVTYITEDTVPFTSPHHALKTRDEALEKIVEIFETSRK